MYFWLLITDKNFQLIFPFVSILIISKKNYCSINIAWLEEIGFKTRIFEIKWVSYIF